MTASADDWHAHSQGDEVFIVLSGILFIDTDAASHELTENMMMIVPAGARHSARVEPQATMIVIDNFDEEQA